MILPICWITGWETSHLVWGVWIEILWYALSRSILSPVTPRMRCVDWNLVGTIRPFAIIIVTPRMRCVDWNKAHASASSLASSSHLVWGVWIEISGHFALETVISYVTPRMRCVDWNKPADYTSLHFPMVTPRMRCVDWNIGLPDMHYADHGGHTSYEVCGLK